MPDTYEFSAADRKRIYRETLGHLKNLIRIDTTNPPGNEMAACEYVRTVLAADGVESEILESAPGRGNIIARLRGDGSKRPLLLGAHLDVVPAMAENWSVPPFDAVEKDGFLWGRGAIDCKHQVAFMLQTFLEIKRRCLPLKRDIILCFTADEEGTCTYGMGWMVRNHLDKIQCEFALNEGGGYAIPLEGANIYFCQNAEKGVFWLKLITEAEPGHSSVPHKNNPIARMGAALHELNKPRSIRRTAIMETLLDELAALLPFPKNQAVRQLLNPVLSDVVLTAIKSEQPQIADVVSSLLRNTTSPTQVNAGYKENVIPERCEAIIDCRILPGMTAEKFTKKLMRQVAVDRCEPLDAPQPNPSESPINTELYHVIRNVIARRDPGSVVTPFLFFGGTDNGFLRDKGITAYGFCPMKSKAHPGEYLNTAHGVDERIPLDAIEYGVTVYFDIVAELCC